MKEYFKPTGKKILGVIILLFLFSFLGFFLQYIGNPLGYTGEFSIPVGLPLPYVSLGSSISNLNIIYLIIDVIIFYLITCLLAIIFRRRKVENVPNSDSGRRDTGAPNQAQP